MKRYYFIFYLLFITTLFSCSDSSFIEDSQIETISSIETRAVRPQIFDWENSDYMPTPIGQPEISVPWIGQGSLASSYTLDVINDHRVADGWRLLYSTFTDKGDAPLNNPYFILYNVYRGLMRVYLYINTPFVTTSSYLQDCLSVSTNRDDIKLLNFMGTEIVDGSSSRKSYQQIQPAPINGGSPLATNRWYMFQYELAYDPKIRSIPYNDIHLVWNANYIDVSSISLGGDIQGTIKGVIGEQSEGSILQAIEKDGVKIGTGALALVGKDVLDKYKTNDDGNNTIGLPKSLFKGIYDGVKKATTNFPSGISSGITNLFSAIIGGARSTATPISLNINAQISLTGTKTSTGALPSTPIDVYMPGTKIPSDAKGQIPLINNPLGICNMLVKPDFTITIHEFNFDSKDMPPSGYYSHIKEEFAILPSDTINYRKYLVINPTLANYATFTVKQEIIGVKKNYIRNGEYEYHYETNPTHMYACSGAGQYSEFVNKPFRANDFYVRFTFFIRPKNLGPLVVIYKTFKLNVIKKRISHNGVPDYTIFNWQY